MAINYGPSGLSNPLSGSPYSREKQIPQVYSSIRTAVNEFMEAIRKPVEEAFKSGISTQEKANSAENDTGGNVNAVG